MTYIYIGIAGMAGSILRYLISIMTVSLWGSQFPFGTLSVNVFGAFILGLFTKMVIEKARLNPQLNLAIGTGAIGSFTTLSTLSTDTVIMIEKDVYVSAFFYILASIIGGLAAGFAGYRFRTAKKEGASG